MSASISNLVQQTTNSAGTSALTLAAVSGYQTFATAFGTGSATNLFYYFITDTANNAWEVGTGHLSNATTLMRDTVLHSSNSNAPVNFAAGSKLVVNDLPAEFQNIPSGANGQVQFNDGGVFGASANFTFDKTLSSAKIGSGSVTGTTSVSVGTNNTVAGNNSMAIGGSNNILYNVSLAIGVFNQIQSAGSVAIGNSNEIYGGFGFLFGDGNYIDVSAIYATGFGAGQIISAPYSFACGAYHTIDTHAEYSAAFGASNTISGYASVAFGENNTVSGDHALGQGYINTVSGNGASAFGLYNTSSGLGSVTGGYGNTASNQGAVSFGTNNVNNGPGAVCLGYLNTNYGSGACQIGNQNTTNHTYASQIGDNNYLVNGYGGFQLGSHLTNAGTYSRVGMLGDGQTTYTASTADNQFVSRFSGGHYFLAAGTTVASANLAIAPTGTVGIGTVSPDASAQMEIASTSRGFLPPRMSTTQKNAISSPVEGLIVYDTTLHKLCVKTASAWEIVTSV